MQGLSIEDGKPRTLVFSVTATTSIKRVNVKYLTSVLEMRIKGSSGGELYRSVIAVHSKGLHLQCCLLRFMAEAESLRSLLLLPFFFLTPSTSVFLAHTGHQKVFDGITEVSVFCVRYQCEGKARRDFFCHDCWQCVVSLDKGAR